MLRKLGAASVAAAALVPLLAMPASALEPAIEADGPVAATAPAVPVAGVPGDGLTEVHVELPLDDGPVDVVLPDHGHAATRSGVVALPSAPKMVLFEDVPEGVHLAVRSRNHGTWSPWTELAVHADDAPDGAREVAPGVGPVWLGDGTEQLEVALVEGDATEVDVVGLHPTSEQPTPQAFSARAFTTVQANVAQAATGTFIRPRSQWAASGSGWKCNGSPTATDDLRGMVVHHTASGTRAYAASEVPELLRGFWRFHTGTRGWCDVAYNFFVDRFGGVWEGRQGGITRAIQGGHTYGFNTNTTSVAQVGDLHASVPSAAMTAATGRLVGWKLGLHGLDPQGRTTLTNRTGSTFKGVPNGGPVPVPVVSGHRDLGSTACPGQHTYSRLGSIRSHARTGAHLATIYEAFLGTKADPTGYLHWMGIAEQRGLRAAATQLAYSPEYAGVLLDDLYQRVLGRRADASGKAHWLRELSSGMRIEAVGALFYGSEEYVARAGSLDRYIGLLYQNLLHRSPDAAGLQYWTGMLRSGAASPPAVASGFYASRESRLDRVARLYQRFLGREPDRAGQAHWADQLLRTDDIVLAVELSLADEFYARTTS